jgi:hypothetical protein
MNTNEKKLIIMVLNFSGNVGKSVISRHLLAPRLNAQVVPVETINSDEHETDSIKGSQFSSLVENLMTIDDSVVIDVGASNVESLLEEMKKIAYSHEDFDYFIIPTVSETKQQQDTVKTIIELNEIGIPSEKIRLIFNKVDSPNDIPTIFHAIFDYHKQQRHFELNLAAIIRASDIYGRISGKTIQELSDDETNYKEMATDKTKTQEERLYWSVQLTNKRLAVGVNLELDKVFNALNLGG